MTLKNNAGTLIHYPSKPDFFEFDGDVAEVFDNMAERSIPMYAESHKINAKITAAWLRKQQETSDRVFHLMDVGASTGGFFAALHDEMKVPYHESIPNVALHAVDISRPMLDKLSAKLPRVVTYECSILEMGNYAGLFDIVNVSYVLQFLKPNQIVAAVGEVRSCMQKSGLLFLSQKEKISTGWASRFQEDYIDFRKENGYSEEEIEAKTQALKGSMFPQSMKTIRDVLWSQRFEQMQETSRWLQFSSIVAIAT